MKQLEDDLINKPSLPDSLRAENNYLLGKHYERLTKIDSAGLFYYNATEYIKDSITKEREGYYFASAWSAYYRLGLYADCLTLCKKFKSLLDPKTQTKSFSWAHYWEQVTYQQLGDMVNAEKAIAEQVAVARKYDTINLYSALISQSEFKYYRLGNKKEAYGILENLIANEHKVPKRYLSSIYTNYGVYEYYAGDYRSALSNYLKAQKAAKAYAFEDPAEQLNNLANGYSNIAEVYMDLNDHGSARKYLDSVRSLGIENFDRGKQKNILNYELRYAMETSKDSKNVTSIIEEINAHQDELYQQKTEKELLALTKANEKEKVLLIQQQNAQIENLKLQNRSTILLVSIALLGIIGFLFYQRRKLKFEKQNLQNQQRLLRSQMNPHFTFNTLYAIQNQIKKEPEAATNYLLKFSRLLRLFLENSLGDYVALEKEVESLKKYMDLQLLRVQKPFQYEFSYENMEEDELLFIPPMLLQPFVENSIEHGFSDIEHTGKITITLALQNKFIACTIEDNGKGLSHKANDQKHSVSTQLIAKFIKKSTKKDLEIIDKGTLDSEGSGLLIRFLIPFKLTEHD
ncbi:MAG: histidine kinase [Flavobacteriaceae bacterium]|nr:histidine kinase [Flavobacteriaceae bacterium]